MWQNETTIRKAINFKNWQKPYSFTAGRMKNNCYGKIMTESICEQ